MRTQVDGRRLGAARSVTAVLVAASVVATACGSVNELATEPSAAHDAPPVAARVVRDIAASDPDIDARPDQSSGRPAIEDEDDNPGRNVRPISDLASVQVESDWRLNGDRLAVAPDGATASGSLPPGLVVLDDGVGDLPAGVVVRGVSEPRDAPELWGATPIQVAFELVGDLSGRRPIRLSIASEGLGVDRPELLTLARWDDGAEVWVPRPVVDDPSTGRLRAWTDEAGTYQLFRWSGASTAGGHDLTPWVLADLGVRLNTIAAQVVARADRPRSASGSSPSCGIGPVPHDLSLELDWPSASAPVRWCMRDGNAGSIVKLTGIGGSTGVVLEADGLEPQLESWPQSFASLGVAPSGAFFDDLILALGGLHYLPVGATIAYPLPEGRDVSRSTVIGIESEPAPAAEIAVEIVRALWLANRELGAQAATCLGPMIAPAGPTGSGPTLGTVLDCLDDLLATRTTSALAPLRVGAVIAAAGAFTTDPPQTADPSLTRGSVTIRRQATAPTTVSTTPAVATVAPTPAPDLLGPLGVGAPCPDRVGGRVILWGATTQFEVMVCEPAQGPTRLLARERNEGPEREVIADASAVDDHYATDGPITSARYRAHPVEFAIDTATARHRVGWTVGPDGAFPEHRAFRSEAVTLAPGCGIDCDDAVPTEVARTAMADLIDWAALDLDLAGGAMDRFLWAYARESLAICRAGDWPVTAERHGAYDGLDADEAADREILDWGANDREGPDFLTLIGPGVEYWDRVEFTGCAGS